MSVQLADIPVPPRCEDMIRAGALVAISTSGGKDSQAMTILLSRIVPPHPAPRHPCAARRRRMAGDP